eukprot:1491621-Amphidinium_carterae.1
MNTSKLTAWKDLTQSRSEHDKRAPPQKKGTQANIGPVPMDLDAFSKGKAKGAKNAWEKGKGKGKENKGKGKKG